MTAKKTQKKSAASNLKNGKGIGRPKGAKDKTSATAKENILAVFSRLKGTAGMAKWAEENQTEFYRIYARLLPKEVNQTLEIKEPKTREEIVAAAESLGMPTETIFDEPGSRPTTH